MTVDRNLLDNLHGRITALTMLCSAMIATSKDPGAITALFQKDLEHMHKADPSDKSEHYFLGMKAVQDQILHAVKQVQLDLSAAKGKARKH